MTIGPLVTGVATVGDGSGLETAAAEVVDPVSPAQEESASNDAVRSPR